MQIRTFSENDTEAVIKLWQKCGLIRSWNNPYMDIQRKLSTQPELFLVGEMDNTLISTAMAGYDGHRGSVYYLAVAPEYHHRGYGRMLMNKIEEILIAMGCPKLNILVRSTNLKVIEFYRKLGYSTDEVACLGKRVISDTSGK